MPRVVWCSLAAIGALVVCSRWGAAPLRRDAAAFAAAVAPVLFVMAGVDANQPLVALHRCGAFDTRAEVYVAQAALWTLAVGLLFRLLFRALAIRAARWLLAGVRGVFALALLLVAAGVVRSIRLPSWATYVDRMPVVGGMAKSAGWPDETFMSFGGAMWTRSSFDPLELRRGERTWLPRSGECATDLFGRIAIRYAEADRLWVIEDTHGSRCPVDEDRERPTDLRPSRVPGSPPIVWHLPAAVAAVFTGVCLARVRRRAPTVSRHSPYRSAPERDEYDIVLRSHRTRMLVTIAVGAVGCAPSIALVLAGFLF